MNKLIESKLRRLVQKEIKSVLKEKDEDLLELDELKREFKTLIDGNFRKAYVMEMVEEIPLDLQHKLEDFLHIKIERLQNHMIVVYSIDYAEDDIMKDFEDYFR